MIHQPKARKRAQTIRRGRHIWRISSEELTSHTILKYTEWSGERETRYSGSSGQAARRSMKGPQELLQAPKLKTFNGLSVHSEVVEIIDLTNEA